MKFEIEEGQRQMLLLAIAELALSRPGWDWTLGNLAEQFGGREMFTELKRVNADRVKAERGPLGPCIAQSDDEELLEWLANAQQRGGGFIKHLAEAALRADHENYPLIRPLLVAIRVKYPDYEPSDQVKREICDRVKS